MAHQLGRIVWDLAPPRPDRADRRRDLLAGCILVGIVLAIGVLIGAWLW